MFLVTGGAGFIGSNIVAALEQRGKGPLVICDRLRDGDKWLNVGKRELAEIVHPDHLLDFLEDNRAGIEAIIHMGAVSSTVATDVDLMLNTNFKLSLGLWKWCAVNRVRFLYASSAATYGDGAEGFDDDAEPEALSRLRPLNSYGWTKHMFDRRITRMLADGEPGPPQLAGFKFFNVYGPNEYHKGGQQSVVAGIFPTARAGKPVRLFKSHHSDYQDGGQMRDFTWIDDCVDVVMWFVENSEANGLFNCGTGKARTFADLATAVFLALDKEPQIKYLATPAAIRDKYQYFTEARMDRLADAGYDKPFTPLEEGVGKYITEFLDTDDRYR
ncbi:MAG: ADP-glyceromanno-heptose 6-epimerase [Rhodospirillales bacterium]|jgi:ADP-L-glycero-D-manno-heptose 6-epimerase|nr:ADP-glyceromanno-heptose 6-epimerase [Rhodospirillales bacterium]MDP7097941.1 ADP-glyceromanno-heptose 6-epimerase [Rhodospirillales bacterium]MDP7215383.1 ADP-glyceromanno-heptose 6-epimerase [Rhodospirillales bacterium]HJP55339.1 ADP-glyceromanno-heptose 6-epimerase [Rhodospirillales bacterium]